MLRTFLISLSAITLFICGLQATGNDILNTKHNTAQVNTDQGLLLFVESTPVDDYTTLGTVNGKSALSVSAEQYNDVKKLLIKRVKKEFPAATGIIFYFDNTGRDHADAIQFKE